MKLSDFKRPPGDNGRALQAPPEPNWNGGQQGLDYWLSELVALNVKWLHILDDGGDSLPLCERLLAQDIFPIVRILRRDPAPNEHSAPNPGHLNAREEESVRRLIAAGVLYFETNDEPDLASAWKQHLKPEPEDYAADIVILNWLFDARFILDAGGYPALPAVSSGGNFDLLGALAKTGHLDILPEGCWLSVHNFAQNRPFAFPQDDVNQTGTPLDASEYEQAELTNWVWYNDRAKRTDSRAAISARREKGKRPGQKLSDDHACLREFEYYHTRVSELLGSALPILSTAGGYSVGNRDDLRYPRISPTIHAALTVSLFDYIQTRAPEYYFCAMGGRLSDAGDDPNAWYGDYWSKQLSTPSAPLPVVSAVKQMPVRAGRGVHLEASVESPASPLPSFPIPDTMPFEVAYVVKEGETLADIANRFGVTDYALARFNRISEMNAPLTGKKLIIPSPLVRDLPPVVGQEAPITKMIVPPPPPRAGITGEWDPRLTVLKITCERASVRAGEWYWKLVHAEYQDGVQANSQHDVTFILQDQDGAPVATETVLLETDSETEKAETDALGSAALTMWAGFFPDRGESGVYRARVQGASDIVAGLGLPSQNLACFRLSFQRTRK
ncbi:MAG TPA: LysM peptidoglycan-binding domain-containing protein [Anaerolineae bacterium]